MALRIVILALILSLPARAPEATWWERAQACWNYALRAATASTYATFGEDEWRDTYLKAKDASDTRKGTFALLQLVAIKANELQLTPETRAALSRFLKYKNRPDVVLIEQDGVSAPRARAGLVSSFLLLDEWLRGKDALGELVPLRTRAGRVATSLIVDLLWAHGPFAWRNLFDMRAATGLYSLSSDVPNPNWPAMAVRVAAWAEALGVENDSFFCDCLTGARTDASARTIRPSRWKKLAALVRPAILAYVLVSNGLHVGMNISQWAFDNSRPTQRAPVSRDTLPVAAMTQAWNQQAEVDVTGKHVTFLVDKGLWDDFWSGDESVLRSLPPYAEIAEKAASFRVEVFASEDDLVSAMNRDRSEEVLMLAVHGKPRQPGTFEVGKRNVKDFIERIETKPLPKGASLFFLICDFGDRLGAPVEPDDEAWLAISKKKLHPEGGTAIAATANIHTPTSLNRWGERLRNIGYTGLYGITGPFAGLVAQAQRQEQERRQQWRSLLDESWPYEFDPGVRVYDRASNRVRFYRWEIDGNGNNRFIE